MESEAVYMYAQFEAAGLIVGTEEWEEAQEKRYLQMIGEGNGDAGRERDNGQTVLACG